MTGAGPQSGSAATGTVLGIVCSALLGSVGLFFWDDLGMLQGFLLSALFISVCIAFGMKIEKEDYSDEYGGPSEKSWF
jgi:hypothetical protein